MATKKEKELDAIQATIAELQEKIESLKADCDEVRNEGMVQIKPASDGIHNDYTSTFKAGSLTLNFDARVEVKSGRAIVNTETMMDANLGKIFSRSLNFAPSQIIVTYEFGDAVQGIDTLTLIGENSAQSRFVYGYADGREILPMRYDKAQAHSNIGGKNSPFVMVRNEDGAAEALTIKMPKVFVENLALLIPVIEKAILSERYTPKSIGLSGSYGCFWGILACELAAKACILGCGVTGPLVPACVVVCLIAEVACMMAVLESKEATTLLV